MKMKILLAFAVSVMVYCACTTPSQKSTFDRSAVGPFWQVVSVLENDAEPSDDQWNSLFQTPGYIEFNWREMGVERMKKYLRYSIMPSQQEGYEELLASRSWFAKRMPPHLRDVVKKKEEINRFLEEIGKDNFQEHSLELALQYFPKGITVDKFPSIAFIFFDKDARGYDPILIDPLFAMQLEQSNDLKHMLAHEMHHYILKQYLMFEKPPRDSTDSRLLWILDQVYKEGFADQIDKDIMFSKPENEQFTQKYKEYLSGTPQNIHQLDSMLCCYANDKSSRKEIAKVIRKTTPLSGHPMGYFMAKTIMQYQSKEALMEDIGNPFAFFVRYNKAALKSNGEKPLFSDTSIELIQQLEKRYAKPLN